MSRRFGPGPSRPRELAGAGVSGLLARPRFRLLYGARLTAQTADGILQAGLAAYVFFSPEQQPTPGKVAAAFAVLLLPYSLIGPFTGVLLDRWRRRQVLIHSNVARIVLVLGLAALVATRMEGPLFFGAALVVLSVARFFLAALSTALPHAVRGDQLVLANTVSTTSGTVVAFVGGGIGYGLRWLFGVGPGGTAGILGVAAGAYLCSSLVAGTMHRDALGPDRPPGRAGTAGGLRQVGRGLTAAAGHVWARRPARAALATVAGHRFCYGITLVMMLLLYRNYFHPDNVLAGLGGLALAGAATGAGYLVGAFVTPLATARVRKEAWITALLLGAGVLVFALGVPFRQAPLVVAGGVLGIVSQGLKISVDTIVQESVADHHRGWVFSCFDVLYNVAFVGAASFAATTLPPDGTSYALLGVVAACYLGTGALYWWASRLRHPGGDAPRKGTDSPGGDAFLARPTS